MEEFKENKSAIITIVCFALIILGIVGYFVYDSFFKTNKIEKKFDITFSEVNLKVNEVKDIKNYITLENVELNEITFTSSDKDIAYIEDTSIVAPSKEGIATITATYKKIVKKITIKVGDVKVNTETDIKEPITATDPITNQYGIELYPKTKKITLDGENVNVKLGNDLELSFIGKLSEENHNEPIYQYNLNINKTGTIINTDILGSNYNIYSSNYTSIFEVFEFNNNYVFKSYIGKQCKGMYVVIYDKSFNLLKSFNDVDIFFNNDNTIEVNDYDTCMPDCTTQANMNDIISTKTKYKYNGTSLEEIEKITKTYADICNH